MNPEPYTDHPKASFHSPRRSRNPYLSQMMQKTPSSEPRQPIRSIPTSNPIKNPTPDTLSNFERLPFTRKPGG